MFPVTIQNYFSGISKDGLRKGEAGALARTEGTLLNIPVLILMLAMVWMWAPLFTCKRRGQQHGNMAHKR